MLNAKPLSYLGSHAYSCFDFFHKLVHKSFLETWNVEISNLDIIPLDMSPIC